MIFYPERGKFSLTFQKEESNLAKYSVFGRIEVKATT